MAEEENRFKKKKKRKWQFPDTYVLILGLMLLAVVMTYVVPAGNFERMEDPSSGQMVVQPGTYESAEQTPVSFLDFFMAVPQGLEKNAVTVFFIFLIGGCFGVVNATGSLHQLIRKSITAGKGKSGEIIIAVLLIVFGLAGGVVGMAEECLAFLPILVTLAIGLGYDAVVGVAIMLMGVCFGYGTAPINLFTVGLAQSIAGLPLFSGMWYRWILWGVSAVVAVAFLIHYCRKVKADPSKSLVADLDYSEFCLEDVGETKLTKRQGAVLTCFFGGIILLMAMIVLKGWYMTELSAYFFGLALVCGLVYGMSLNEMARHFVDGMKDMVYPAILVGIAAGISIIMENGNILDSIVNAFAQPLSHTPQVINGGLMMFVQTLINLFIPSGTGQAVVTMPLMAPLADVVGITRQTAVLAYQLGDGCSNCIIPTGAMMMAAISFGKVPYVRWAKFIAKWLGLQLIIGFSFCVIASVIQLGPF